MVLDIAIVTMLAGFSLTGCVRGFIRGFCPLVVPTAGLVLALKNYGAVATMLNSLIHNHSIAIAAAFLLLLSLSWVGAKLVRRLLLKLFDWRRLEELDYFLGGVFGLARGLALVWMALAALLTSFPPSLDIIETSRASTRVLALAEHLAGNNPLRGTLVPVVQAKAGAVCHTVAAFRNLVDPLLKLEEN
ncbi:MAG: CvpA family protein [candidate division WOR-3 bacterium]